MPVGGFGVLDARETALLNAGVLAVCVGTTATLLLQNDVRLIADMWHDSHLTATAVGDLAKRFPTDWLAWYDEHAVAHPIVTKACTSGFCYAVGDLLAQALSDDGSRSVGDAPTDVTPTAAAAWAGAVVGAAAARDDGGGADAAQRRLARLDLRRAACSAGAGFVGHGPVAHVWLQFVDTRLAFGGAWWAVVPKIAIDQGPMSIVYNTVYTVLTGAFALRPAALVWRDVRETWWPSMRVSLQFWPPVHLVTFSSLVPLELKLLWVDVMEIVWIAILSKVNADGRGDATPPPPSDAEGGRVGSPPSDAPALAAAAAARSAGPAVGGR